MVEVRQIDPPVPSGPLGPEPPRRQRSCLTVVFSALIALAVIGGAARFWYGTQFATPAIIENDGYFHIKYSYLMSHGHGIMFKLPWLQYTIHRDEFRDHHFLFHVLYIPFTFGDLAKGAKVGAWLFAIFGTAMFYFAAARRGRIVAAILTFVLLGSNAIFISRMNFGRVPALSMGMLLLGIHLIITRRYRWLAAATFAYALMYDGFILLLGAGACFVLAELLVARRFDGKLVKWLLIGAAAGIIINPYFFKPYLGANIASYWFNLVRASGRAQTMIQRTGQEWLTLDSWQILRAAPGVWLALALAGLLAILRGRPTRETTALFLITVAATVLLMKARRYLDTWPPLALLFLAYAWADFWEERVWARPVSGRLWRWGATVALAGLLVWTPARYAEGVERHSTERPLDYFRGAALWLRDNTAPGTIVFNSDWDDFPYLFFWNSENYYIVGLDQIYMMRYDPKLYDEWKNISDGLVEKPSRMIYDDFGAQYAVVARTDRPVFLARAELDPNMRPVYTDLNCVVYRILPP